MSSASTDKQPEKKSIGGELVIPVAALAFTLYYFSTIIDSPWTAQVSAVFIGTVLIVLIAIFAARVVIRRYRGEVDLRIGVLIEPYSVAGKRAALLGLTLAFILVIPYAGFTITTFVFMTLGMLVLADWRRKRFVVVLCAVLAIAGWALFIYAFETRFPSGPFERLMQGIL
ncbi:MAG: tripartite tricarboxylate transporter TctB family protein [Gammaproteobacteria bacterium]|nr:tripartite tricarboxylate transporter TctB family protein [Gammaproteobacteria bacterium]